MNYIDKFKTGDVIIKKNIGLTTYSHQFTNKKKYKVLSGEECGKSPNFNYVMNDGGNIQALIEKHFDICTEFKRNETIEYILS